MATTTPAVSAMPLFGRRWDLTITTQSGDQIELSSSAWEPEALRITFDIEQTYGRAMWFAEIAVYNLASNAGNLVIQPGDTVTLNAGYQVGQNYGNIFTGKVLQPLFEKLDNLDSCMRLFCIVGFDDLIDSIVNFALAGQPTQAACLAAVCKNAKPNPIPVQHIDPSLDQKKLAAPKAFIGSPSKYFDQVARDNNMVWFRGSDGIYIGPPQAPSGIPDIVYSSPLPPDQAPASDATISYSIVGTPQQTHQGVAFRVLLDARLLVKLPAMQVKIDNTVIRRIPVQFGS